MKLAPRFLALGAFFVVAIALAACGGSSIPGNSVAKVGGTSITKDDFNHWLRIAAISSQGQTNPDIASGKAQAQIPDAPDFKQCVANKTTTAPKPAKGQPAPTTAQFKQQCQTEYNGLRDQVLQFLISAQWIVGEAGDQGVKVTDAEVTKQFDTTKKQSFPKEADFQKFLKSSGMGLDDLKFRVKVQALSDKLRTKVTKGKDTVTDAQVSAYYNKNKSRFAQPERRDLKIVLTKTKAKADTAFAALKSGKSFKAIAKKYSIDQASKNQGGKLLAVAKGQQEKALDDAVFKAQKGKLSGPIKTQFGYYVFEVSKVTAASQQTLTQATPTIKQLLQSQNQQKALDSFVKDFQKRWKDKTNCRNGFVTQDCKNAPKPKSTSTVPPGGVTTQQNAPPANQGTTTSGG
jgi:parvulin-like peptidyl-prolyl isomerase